MKITNIAAALALTALCACNSNEQKAAEKKEAPAASEASAVPPVQSQAAYDAEAAKSIDKANADAEFEKLQKEIDGG